jgi:hypothetical protein
MKLTATIGVIALCSTLSACWFYSKPEGDPGSGCRTTTYGVAIASTSNTNCPPSNPPPPELPSPSL